MPPKMKKMMIAAERGGSSESGGKEASFEKWTALRAKGSRMHDSHDATSLMSLMVCMA
jgi:hypothetical protein